MILDLLILIPLILGAYRGYVSGLLSEVVGVLHFLLAFIVSFKIIGIILKLISAYLFVFNPMLMAQVAFAAATGATFALLMSLGQYLQTEIKYDFPGAWDNIIGAIFGMIKTVVAISFFIWFMSIFGAPKQEQRDSAKLYVIIEIVAPQIVGVKNGQELSRAIRDNL